MTLVYLICCNFGRMYDNLILGIDMMSIWFGLKTGRDSTRLVGTLQVMGKVMKCR
jgi:hypothetical protein